MNQLNRLITGALNDDERRLVHDAFVKKEHRWFIFEVDEIGKLKYVASFTQERDEALDLYEDENKYLVTFIEKW